MEVVKYLKWTFKYGNWSILLGLLLCCIVNVVLFFMFGFPILSVFTFVVVAILFVANLVLDYDNFKTMESRKKK
jgi:hypothetical protein